MEEESVHSTESLTLELFTDSENETGQFCFKEEMIEEVMQEFYKEIVTSPTVTTTPLPVPQSNVQPENVVVVAEVKDAASDLFVGLEVVADGGQENQGHDFDDEWLSRVLLTWGQCQVAETDD